MSTQPLTCERVLELFQERLAKSGLEFDRKIDRMTEAADKRQEAIDKRIEKLASNMGNVELRVGDLVEHIIGGKNIVVQFQTLGYSVNDHSRNIVFGISNAADRGD